ncbi:MAG: DUF3105 domain-containing protein, partial [Actinomycetota bacterium]
MPKKRRKPRNRPRTNRPTTGRTARTTEDDPGADRPVPPGQRERADRDEVERPPVPPGRRSRADRDEIARPVPPGQRSRAEKKELARRARETAVKSARRRRGFRRTLQVAILVAIAVGVYVFLTTAGAPGDVPESAVQAAEAAGCGEVQTPTGAPARGHLAPGETLTYEQRPATSGDHAPAPLPSEPHVYTTPVEETAAVHNLEHAYVLIYYRAEGADALSADVIDELTGLAESETKVIMA